jgi:receptor protein-tyrosine kinase/non-specific protein-tyrosine kinase
MSRIERALEQATKLRTVTQRTDLIVKPFIPPASQERDFLPPNPYVVTFNAPDSPIAEEYKKLKSMIIKLTRRQGFQNVLMVTSSLSGEGKSLTSLNLAITLAHEYNHSVLLIDADMRKPSLHPYLGIAPRTGLADCLAGKVGLGDAIMKTGVAKLSFLPAGKNTGDPVTLTSSCVMKGLIDEVKQRYPDRYVIIDTPPTLLFAETHAISALVDGVLFVVRENVSTMQNIKDAVDILKDSTILGIVYNSVSMERVDGYHHYRAYYRSYKKEPSEQA